MGLKDEFWFVHVPFGSMVKFVQFLIEHLSHPVLYSFGTGLLHLIIIIIIGRSVICFLLKAFENRGAL